VCCLRAQMRQGLRKTSTFLDWSLPEDLLAKFSEIEQASDWLFLPQCLMPVNFSGHLFHLVYF
jgi:hypothetical protein